MQLTPRAALRACAILLILVAAAALPGTAKVLSLPASCRDIDSMDADAWGEAVALIVRIDGEDVLESPYSQVSAFQDGPGMNHSEDSYLPIEVPGILTAKILNSRVDLKVTEDPLEAKAWSQASVVELDILNGTITADVVKAWANAEAMTSGAFTRTIDSTIVGLHVGDLGHVDVAPGAQLVLGGALDAVAGEGAFVKTYVRDDASKIPVNGSIFYEGDTTVTMLHIYLPNVLGTKVEIIVSQAHAHAQVPTPFCGLIQSVEAAAYVARVRPELFSPTSLLVGEQHIGVVGGHGKQQLLGVQVPVGDFSLAEVNVTETEVSGFVDPGIQSRSFAMSKVLGLCIDQNGEVVNKTDPDYGDCFISATAIRAESNSMANATEAISWGTVTIVGLVIDGVDVCEALLQMPDENEVEGNNTSTTNICKPPKNSVLEIGPITVTFNQRERDREQVGHTGYYVRAVRIQGPVIGDIIISRAYTSADFVPEGGMMWDGPLEGEKA